MLLKDYDNIIKQQLKETIIERVTQAQDINPGRIHYIPHHAVVRADKETTKLRIVYDAPSNSPSLNDCLEKGPCLLPLIFDILVRFRAYRVALISDIKQAYLNVEVNENNRNFLRFLCVDYVNSQTPNIITYRFTRVIFGMNSSQYLLAAVILKHFKKYEVLELYIKSKYRLLEAGLTLGKWHSNEPIIEEHISKCEKDVIIECPSAPSPSNQLKVLGIIWENVEDEFVMNFSIDQISNEACRTKRKILKAIASIYDPLGLISPATVMFKVFFQLLCLSKLSWDDPLPQVLDAKWKNLVDHTNYVSVTVPRFYFGTLSITNGDITLHGFCDASRMAYAAVVYIVSNESGVTTGQLVACKTKVAPKNDNRTAITIICLLLIV